MLILPYVIILFAKFSSWCEIFCLVNHLHGLPMPYFYDFICRNICCKVPGTEIYASQVYKLKIVGNDLVQVFCHYIAIISGFSFLRYDKKKEKQNQKHGERQSQRP